MGDTGFSQAGAGLARWLLYGCVLLMRHRRVWPGSLLLFETAVARRMDI